MKSFLGRMDLPRGLRNNNPGNLVRSNNAWQGKIPFAQSTDFQFEQFTELRYGIRAMLKDIAGDIGEGTNTLSALLHEYAPSHENNTSAYIDFVSGITGLLPDVQINLSKGLLIAIAKANVAFENGLQYAGLVENSDYESAYAISGLNLPETMLPADLKKKSCSQA